jgi:hypothetical protein
LPPNRHQRFLDYLLLEKELATSEPIGLSLNDTLREERLPLPHAQRGIAFLPASEKGYFDALAPDFELILQNGPDLGTRLDEGNYV